jgi:hypothetical protein
MTNSFTAAWRVIDALDDYSGATNFQVVDADVLKPATVWVVMSDNGYVVLRTRLKSLAAAVADALTTAAKDGA